MKNGNKIKSVNGRRKVVPRAEAMEARSQKEKEISATVVPHIDIDKSLIQVVANKEELDRRISAFCKRKRGELDRANCLEFCNLKEDGVGDSCARVLAVLHRKTGSKSHLRTSTVKNVSGPNVQMTTHATGSEVKKMKLELTDFDQISLPLPLENRMSELEKKVTFGENKPVPIDIYTRLKILEERIELLEGISPEYCQPVKISSVKSEQDEIQERSKHRKTQIQLSLSDLDDRILSLKNLLQTKIMKVEADSD